MPSKVRIGITIHRLTDPSRPTPWFIIERNPSTSLITAKRVAIVATPTDKIRAMPEVFRCHSGQGRKIVLIG